MFPKILVHGRLVHAVGSGNAGRRHRDRFPVRYHPVPRQAVLSKLYFTRVEYPKILARYNERRPADNLFLAKLSAAEAREKHQSEIDYFKATLEDLTQTVIARMGSPEALIYIHHPHLEHLHTAGVVFNNLVSETLQDVASRHHVRYYDATGDLKT